MSAPARFGGERVLLLVVAVLCALAWAAGATYRLRVECGPDASGAAAARP